MSPSIWSDDGEIWGQVMYRGGNTYNAYVMYKNGGPIIAYKSFGNGVSAEDWLLDKLENSVFTILQGNIDPV